MTRRRIPRWLRSAAFYVAAVLLAALFMAWGYQRRVQALHQWCDERGPR
jgi:hypothetical protein